MSIFVNLTQFAPGEDLEAPTRSGRGRGGLASLDRPPAAVFAPSPAEMYPRGVRIDTTVVVDNLTDRLCGVSRPTHFHGVATVVTKLHNIVGPDVAVYSRKDFQQLAVIGRMTEDLNQPVRIVGAPFVREPDGVAMSSRNRYLDGEGRVAARALSRSLRQAVTADREAFVATGEPLPPGMVTERVRVVLSAPDAIRVDYIEVLDPQSLRPLDTRRQDVDNGQRRQVLVAVAAHIGPARLIDNVVLGDEDDEDRLLAAIAASAVD